MQPRAWPVVGGTILAVVVAAARLAAQVPGQQPVPARMLRGSTLTVTKHFFSIEAPSREWQWTFADVPSGLMAGATYLCREPSTDERMVVVVLTQVTRPRPDFAANFLRGLAKARPMGGTLSDLRHEASQRPVPGSTKVGGTLRLPDGTQAYWYGYIVQSTRAYIIHHVSLEAREPEAFGRFAGSFRFLAGALAPSEPPPPLDRGTLLVCLYFGALILGLLVAVVVNAAARRPVLNAGLAALLLVAAALALKAIFTDWSGAPSVGGTAGRLLGEALIPIGIASYIYMRGRRPGRPPGGDGA